MATTQVAEAEKKKSAQTYDRKVQGGEAKDGKAHTEMCLSVET